MKVTVDINLGGDVFHVDEDAYQGLRHYLTSLEWAFAEEDGAGEIIADIEGRMGELFKLRLGKYKQVITLGDLEEVMGVLGSPEAISGTAPAGGAARHLLSRRFYRDPDRRILGGVCAGLAAYFSWHPMILRILFIVLALAGSFGIWLYLVLWIVLPEALTTAQKLEMRGDPVTIANIRDSVKAQYEAVREKMHLQSGTNLKTRRET